MCRTRKCFSILFGVAVLAMGRPASAEEVWAVDSNTDSLYVIDTNTGNLVRTVGRLHADPNRFMTPVAMAIRPSDGAIFVNNNSPPSDDGLALVDPNTGLATYIGGPNIEASLAFDAAGTLYTGGGSAGLLRVNTATGATTPVGGPALPRLYGLDYRPADGFLYGITTASSGGVPDLLKINPATGAIAATVTLSTAISGVPGTLLFEKGGKLVSANNASQLFDIDPATGVVTNIRSADEGPQGMGTIIGTARRHPCFWWQPWNKQRPSYTSRVVSCQQPQPNEKIAMDDFICCDDSRIKQVTWWGWLSNKEQARRPFYIAFYKDNDQCFPETPPLYRVCVIPSYVRKQGTDCENRGVWRLSAVLPTAFPAGGGQRYWVQISEADQESYRPGAEDFRWSAHRPCEAVTCWALQGPPLMPLPLDACDQLRNELAFALRSRCVYVRIPLPVTAHPLPGTFQLAQGGNLVDSGEFTLDESGIATLEVEAEDGDYDLLVYTTGGKPLQQTIQLADGECVEVNLPPLCIADVNLDGAINFADVNPFVQCLSQ